MQKKSFGIVLMGVGIVLGALFAITASVGAQDLWGDVGKSKLTLNYEVQPLNRALYRLNHIKGNWYDSEGNLVLTIGNGYINGCKVICGLACGDAYGYRIQESDGYRDMGLVPDHENYKPFLWLDESKILRHSPKPVYKESINGLCIGMSKKYLLEKYGAPTRVDDDQAHRRFPCERWFYSTSFSVFFLDDMAAEITIYDKYNFRFDKSGLNCAEPEVILKQVYSLDEYGEIAKGEYIKFDDEKGSVQLTSYR
jgi:hypothetical protein